MTREQLSRKNLTTKELRVRDKEILRLFATGLYSSYQIAGAYNRSPRRMNKIRAVNREPVNSWMTVHESAEFLDVSPTVITTLIDAGHILTVTFVSKDSPGATLKGVPIYLATRKAYLLNHQNRWGSAEAAARKAGISQKGIEARAQKGNVIRLNAPRGRSFTLYGQADLRYIYDLSKISSAIGLEEKQLQMQLKPKRMNRALMLRAHYQSDLTTDKKIIKCDRELDITVFHTEGKSSKATLIHIGWDEGKVNLTVHVASKVPVTISRTD